MLNEKKVCFYDFIFKFARSTAPAVEPLSEYKQQNKAHSIKNTTLNMIPLQKMSIKNQRLIISSAAGAAELVILQLEL